MLTPTSIIPSVSYLFNTLLFFNNCRLLDVMNHFHASRVRPEMDSEGNIRLYNGSDEAIEPGMEILLNYGDFPNEKLLLVYGFFFFFSDD